MPRLSVWFIRTALLYLACGFSLGGLLLWNKGLPIHPDIWRLLPAHMEFLLLGWTLQLVIGVAYWILPRFRSERSKSELVWLTFGLLNVGIWFVAIGGFMRALPLVQLAGRLLETAAIVAFVIHAWLRVKPAGQ